MPLPCQPQECLALRKLHPTVSGRRTTSENRRLVPTTRTAPADAPVQAWMRCQSGGGPIPRLHGSQPALPGLHGGICMGGIYLCSALLEFHLHVAVGPAMQLVESTPTPRTRAAWTSDSAERNPRESCESLASVCRPARTARIQRPDVRPRLCRKRETETTGEKRPLHHAIATFGTSWRWWREVHPTSGMETGATGNIRTPW